MRRDYLKLTMALLLLLLAAVLVSVKLARAGLITTRVDTTITYTLVGPSFATCETLIDSDRRITVSWKDQDENESGFFIDRVGSDGSQLRLQAPPVPATNTTSTLTDTRAVPDTQYTYTVRSFLGPAESPGKITPLCSTQSLPNQPSGVAAVASGQDSIYLSWQDNASSEDGFKIYRYLQVDPSAMVIVNPPAAPDATFYNDSNQGLGLDSNTTYCYYVVAYNARQSLTPPDPSLVGQPVCAKTWSRPPQITNLQLSHSTGQPGHISSPFPSLSWNYADPDGSGQTKVRVQVCATPFTANDSTPFNYNDDCPAEAWRWDSGEWDSAAHDIQYFANYPNGQQQYLLDFDSVYFIRVMVWDDTDTPSVWTVPTTGPTFIVDKDSSEAQVEKLVSNSGLALTNATFSATHGGYVEFNGASGSMSGSISASGLVGASLKVIMQPGANSSLNWYLKRDTETAWHLLTLQPNSAGQLAGEYAWAEEVTGSALQWQVQVTNAGSVVGGFMITTQTDRPPLINSCRPESQYGNANSPVNFIVEASDPDDEAVDLLVDFDWDEDGLFESTALAYDPVQNRYAHVFTQQNQVFRPRVRALDPHGVYSEVRECEPVIIGTPTPAWLQTTNADIYSRGYIYGRPLTGNYNATYLVQSNGTISNFTTSAGCQPSDAPNCASQVVNPNYRDIRLPDTATNQSLATILGAVDLPGIVAGKYGAVVDLAGPEQVDLVDLFFNTLPPGAAFGSRVLNGQIVHVHGDAVLPPGAPIILDNAGAAQTSGAGLVVVDGDLIIQRPVVYTATAVQGNLKRLASLAWLVKGNVYIDPSLWAVAADLSGACPETGQFDSCVPAVNGSFYLYYAGPNRDQGIFFTGTNQESADNPLKIGGLVVAQRFALQRNRSDAVLPAELFNYDGRIFANTPPGLTDFTKALPRWRPLAPLP